ncbi:hypothetical protein H257_01170 [Aphanomyces astaci]|uniref:Uncharacterized protein n=1 Tax=Aphanomyces astaci TaxID=112090 RepID=W4H998_APHAT|nr:hypothetical protein H257_01170 [Aphanomyces astaci]ETV87683.1 hypothetical protein H257_01170 [Aphanomyces astaci]|eukprot:XP_009822546.1 hypothetical protein H257_01170 [Aphanomyces astaci]
MRQLTTSDWTYPGSTSSPQSFGGVILGTPVFIPHSAIKAIGWPSEAHVIERLLDQVKALGLVPWMYCTYSRQNSAEYDGANTIEPTIRDRHEPQDVLPLNAVPTLLCNHTCL